MKKGGFTIIEMLIVMVIIGIIGTVALVLFNSTRQTSRDARRISDLENIRAAIVQYYEDNTVYPCNTGSEQYVDNQSACLATALQSYIRPFPLDPTFGNDGSESSGEDYGYNTDGDTWYWIRGRLEGSPIERNASYPDGTLCQGASFLTCPWDGQDCIYVTGTDCDEIWVHLSQ